MELHAEPSLFDGCLIEPLPKLGLAGPSHASESQMKIMRSRDSSVTHMCICISPLPGPMRDERIMRVGKVFGHVTYTRYGLFV